MYLTGSIQEKDVHVLADQLHVAYLEAILTEHPSLVGFVRSATAEVRLMQRLLPTLRKYWRDKTSKGLERVHQAGSRNLLTECLSYLIFSQLGVTNQILQ